MWFEVLLLVSAFPNKYRIRYYLAGSGVVVVKPCLRLDFLALNLTAFKFAILVGVAGSSGVRE
jgi:hypothetical protein